MTATVYKSRLIEKIPRVADIVTFRFERPAGYEYRAGQWFNIDFIGPEGQPLNHHFSHSSSPTEPWLEFTTRLRDSEFKRVLRELPIGTEVDLEAPFGSFVLVPGEDPVAFLAGGIGITCVRSILRDCGDEPSRAGNRSMTLLFANRSEDAIPFRDELVEIETKVPGLRVVHVLSRAGDGWSGRRGHIDEDLVESELPKASQWRYYVSGPPSFVGAMREMLAGHGIDPNRVTMERFEGYE
ncbi:MAG: hypothetical protein M1274_15590 [Actinobacteria bacterium]|nr:hypothetical protein [Actinomycetota bacterium]